MAQGPQRPQQLEEVRKDPALEPSREHSPGDTRGGGLSTPIDGRSRRGDIVAVQKSFF